MIVMGQLALLFQNKENQKSSLRMLDKVNSRYLRNHGYNLVYSDEGLHLDDGVWEYSPDISFKKLEAEGLVDAINVLIEEMEFEDSDQRK